MNEVYETDEFTKLYNASEKKEQEWIDKIKDQLLTNLRVGKPLRFDWFREKRFNNKRLYYLINEKTKKAILIAFGSKKDQRQIIEKIIINKERYQKILH